MKTFKRFLMISLALPAMIGVARADDAAFSDAQTKQIQQIIKSYLIENPEVLIEAMQAYKQKQDESIETRAQDVIAKNQDALTGKTLPSTGNPNGDVTVVEFFDYNCGYCRHALGDIENIVGEDKNVRFVFHELPVLGPTSEIAARWSLAAQKQGKYFDFHKAVMKSMGEISDDSLAKIAGGVGLDVDRMKKDAASDEVKQAVRDSRDLAMQLEIQGTPGFIINGTLYRGYLGEDGMKKAIAEARAKKG